MKYLKNNNVAHPSAINRNHQNLPLRVFIWSALIMLCASFAANAQNFTYERTQTFLPENKKVVLLKNSSQPAQKIILIKTDLAVNTDGAPNSYHPQDPRGSTKALNNVCNAIAVRKTDSSANLCLNKTTYGEAIGVFEKWRDSNYASVPSGYTINWQNVLAPSTNSSGTSVPCRFTSGAYTGYFGSLTSLKNSLPSDQQGECQYNNQLDSLQISHLVLAGGSNPVAGFGAQVGDLVIAFNPRNNKMAFAIIGDNGPAKNLGEGSVRMNMTLLDKNDPPKDKKETYKYVVDTALIAIIPASKLFKPQKPFTAANIEERIKKWQQEAGFQTPESFIEMMKSFQNRF